MKKLPYLLILSGLISVPAFADDAPAAPAAKPAAPTLSDVLGASNISMTGYVDATYTYFNKDVPAGSLGEPLRQFDYRKNSFVLNQAAITASYLPTSGFGGLVNLIAGSDGKVLRNSELSPGDTPTNSQFDVYQAYAQYANGPLSVMAGKFATLAGAEVANPTANTTISRSILYFDLEPLSHTGLRAAYAGSAATVTAGVNNGWNYTSAPKDVINGGTISGKTLELGISATPSKMFSLSGDIYSGQAPSANGHGRRDLYDLVATINATDALSFVANMDYLDQKNNTATGDSTKAYGIAAYVNYAFNDQWSLTLRGEYLKDKDGMLTTIPGNKLKEATLDLNYNPTKNATLRAEVRHDSSSSGDPIFDNPVTATSQTSLALEALYKF
jgi:predicted porin